MVVANSGGQERDGDEMRSRPCRQSAPRKKQIAMGNGPEETMEQSEVRRLSIKGG